MIDYSAIPLYEPLPKVKELNYKNVSLAEENSALKRVITALGG